MMEEVQTKDCKGIIFHQLLETTFPKKPCPGTEMKEDTNI